MYYGYDGENDNRDETERESDPPIAGGSYRFTGDQIWQPGEEESSGATGTWNREQDAYSPTSGSFEAEGEKTALSRREIREEKRRQEAGGGDQPPRKRGRFMRVACLVLACAIIGGGTGGIVSRSIIRNWEEDQEAAAASQMDAAASDETDAQGEDENQSNTVLVPASTTASTGEKLSGEEIYALGREQVVGITTEITSANIFGQASTSTVTGSGFIVSSDGYILTNYHVIDGGSQITVMLNDGSYYEAEFVGGVSDTSDMAVLKIDATGLSAATIGSSADMSVGETVYAIGNPLGELTYTITTGIISALDREISVEDSLTINMFQIDAAVNSGNSGGPVYNDRGEVIGIVTAKSSMTGVEGIGFAIPIDDAMNYANQLIETGHISKPYLGIYPVTVSESYAYYYRTVVGVFVNTVYSGTAADNAGVEQGDIITGIDGREITSSDELTAALAAYSPGDQVTLTVYRDGEYLDIGVTLDDYPDEEQLARQQEELEQRDQQEQQTPDSQGGGGFFGG